MSQENVERIQRSLDAFARRDEVAWEELCDPDIRAVPVVDWPEKEIQGRKAVWNFLVASDEPWEPGPYEIGEVIDGADAAVVRLRRDLRGEIQRRRGRVRLLGGLHVRKRQADPGRLVRRS